MIMFFEWLKYLFKVWKKLQDLSIYLSLYICFQWSLFLKTFHNIWLYIPFFIYTFKLLLISGKFCQNVTLKIFFKNIITFFSNALEPDEVKINTNAYFSITFNFNRFWNISTMIKTLQNSNYSISQRSKKEM